MQDIVSELESCRKVNLLSLKQVNPLEVKVSNPKSRQEVMGRIAEAYVSLWLSRCSGISLDTDFPRNANGYRLEKRDSGILVVEKREYGEADLIEYDFLAEHNGTKYVVEVKSRGLNGVEGKIEKSIEVGRHIYGTDKIRMLIFCPECRGQDKFAPIKSKHPEVECINSGYSKIQLEEAIEAYYQTTGQKQWYYPSRHGSSRKGKR